MGVLGGDNPPFAQLFGEQSEWVLCCESMTSAGRPDSVSSSELYMYLLGFFLSSCVWSGELSIPTKIQWPKH